jgi:hypothetical protein
MEPQTCKNCRWWELTTIDWPKRRPMAEGDNAGDPWDGVKGICHAPLPLYSWNTAGLTVDPTIGATCTGCPCWQHVSEVG